MTEEAVGMPGSFPSSARARLRLPKLPKLPKRLALLALPATTAVALAIAASPAAAAPVQTSRVSVAAGGSQSAGPALRPATSADGRYVAFHSTAPDLVPNDTNAAGDVFVKDTNTGAVNRVSITSAGAEANGGSRYPSISSDGRYVAFMSDATNLAPNDTNGCEDIYLRDIASGVTERISVAGDEHEAIGGDSRFPAISADGQYVAFQSQAANLTPGDANGRWDVFLRDRSSGSTSAISVTGGGGQGSGHSARPSISADGRYIVFHSWARLAPGDNNNDADVYVHDRLAGSTTAVTSGYNGNSANGDSLFPKISADGSSVAYHSMANNLVANDTNGARDTFVTALTTSTGTSRVSVSTAGAEPNGTTGYASISSDGRYVAYHGTATNLVAADTNAIQDVFVRDRWAGTTLRVSATGAGADANGLSGSAAISADGAWITYHSQATNLVSNDTNAAQDIFRTARPAA